jgi:streptogramin lyase
MKFPIGLEIAPDGSIYAADHQNNAIRKVSPDGMLTTVAGGPEREGLVNGDISVAQFKAPYGVKLDNTGTLWICDTENGVIRKLSTDGKSPHLPAVHLAMRRAS